MIDIYSKLRELYPKYSQQTSSKPTWLKRSGLNVLELSIGDKITYSGNGYTVMSIQSSSNGKSYGLQHVSSNNLQILVSSDILYKDKLDNHSKDLKAVANLVDLGKSLYSEYFNKSASKYSFEEICEILSEVDDSTSKITAAIKEYQQTKNISSINAASSEALLHILKGIDAQIEKKNMYFNHKASSWLVSTRKQAPSPKYTISKVEDNYILSSDSCATKNLGTKEKAMMILEDMGFDTSEIESKVLKNLEHGKPPVPVTSVNRKSSFQTGDRVVNVNFGVCGTVVDNVKEDETNSNVEVVVNWDEPINGYSLFKVHPSEIKPFADSEVKTKDMGSIDDIHIFVIDPKNLESSVKDYRWKEISAASYLTLGMHYIPNNELWISPKSIASNKVKEIISTELAIIHYMKQGIEYDMAKRMAAVSLEDWTSKYFAPKVRTAEEHNSCDKCKLDMLWSSEDEVWKCPGCNNSKELEMKAGHNALDGRIIVFNKNYNGASLIKKGTIGIIHEVTGSEATIDILAHDGSRVVVANFEKYVETLKDTDLLQDLDIHNLF